MPRRVAGVVLVLALAAFYLWIFVEAYAKIDTAGMSNFDQGQLAGQTFSTLLVPLAIVLGCVGVAARRERENSQDGA